MESLGTFGVFAGQSLSLILIHVSFGFILPINAPQNMVCLGTETFTSKQFTKIGIWLTVIGSVLLLVFELTWWKFPGYI